MGMNCTVKWIDDLAFVAESGNNHCIVVDGNKQRGPSPMELLLMGVGACSSVDVVMILEKARQRVVDVKCELQGERVDGVPAVFTAMNLHFVVTGHELKEKQVARAVELSATKYCSASMTIEKADVTISHSFEIVEA